MDKKIKIALCLSGEPRSSMFSFPYIYESLINLGPGYEVDVYIHSWKNFRALPLYNPKNYKIDWIDEEIFFRRITAEFAKSPLQNNPNTNKDLKNILNNTHNTGALKNTFLMYLSMQRCFSLIKESYDIYIRGRFDFFISYRLNIDEYINSVLNKKDDIILTKLFMESNNLPKDLYDDQFAICNLKGAHYYFNFYNHLIDTIYKSESLNPHNYLKNYLDKSGLNITPLSRGLENIDIVRSSRIITQYHLPYLDN